MDIRHIRGAKAQQQAGVVTAFSASLLERVCAMFVCRIKLNFLIVRLTEKITKTKLKNTI
jgi:hypothetical protein